MPLLPYTINQASWQTLVFICYAHFRSTYMMEATGMWHQNSWKMNVERNKKITIWYLPASRHIIGPVRPWHCLGKVGYIGSIEWYCWGGFSMLGPSHRRSWKVWPFIGFHLLPATISTDQTWWMIQFIYMRTLMDFSDILFDMNNLVVIYQNDC